MPRTLLVALVLLVAACKPKASHDTTCRKFVDLLARCGHESDDARKEWLERCTTSFEPDYGTKSADDYAIMAPLGREMRSMALCAADAKDCDGLQGCYEQVDREAEQRARELQER